ncbi:MAG: cyclic nucleotide-binding domain-containing protein [Planctomycetota bacterium]|nr:cyclic nucleotide-binding domain-containing protein [Planctomycetota bacterium]
MDAPRYERYSTVPLFEGLQPEEIGALLGYSEEVHVEAGEVVIHEGDVPSHFYIVAEGTFDVIKTEGKVPAVLARLSDLSSFGEMGLVSEQEHSASIVAVSDSRVRRFSIEKFQELLDHGDRTAYRMVLGLTKLLAVRLTASDERRVS